MRLAREGDPGPLWVVARSQTGGRGRQGRGWTSPQGNLYTSLLLIDPAPPARAPQLGFVAGVALAQAVRGLLGGDARLVLKWPNDLLHAGAKLSGMLLEGATLPDGRFACVIGFGVNCRSHPNGLAYRATDLTEIGSPCGPEDVLEALSAGMVHWLDRWQAGDGFEAVRTAWMREAMAPGSPLRVVTATRTLEGRFAGLDPAGRLRLSCDTGEIPVDAGDVFLMNHSKENDMTRSNAT